MRILLWGAYCCRVHWVLRERSKRQVRWMDLQGRRKVFGRWKRGRWPIGGPTLLPTYCGRWAPLQSHWRFSGWCHSQEAKGGWHFCSWRNWFHLHLLRTRGATLQESDRKLPEERLAKRHAFPGLGRGANSTLVDYWLHQCLSTGNRNWGGEVDCGGVQLLLRGHLALLGRLLQGWHTQCLLRWHLRGGQGRGQEDGRPDGREGTRNPFQVKRVQLLQHSWEQAFDPFCFIQHACFQRPVWFLTNIAWHLPHSWHKVQWFIEFVRLSIHNTHIFQSTSRGFVMFRCFVLLGTQDDLHAHCLLYAKNFPKALKVGD